jgi:hypothetical protein
MKKTNVTTTLFLTLFTNILVSTTSIAAIPSTELLKAEPIKYLSLKNAAKDSLMQSFSVIETDVSLTEIKANTKLVAHKVRSNKSQPRSFSKTASLAD